MRRVIAVTDSMPTLIAATAVLAAGVSFIELACTAGFPVLWINIVVARDVSPTVFALLLGLYMLMYQLDELVIFGAAVVTLRATKPQERQGRLLKLVGGMLMLSLALVMLVNPSLMSNLRTSLLVFAAAGRGDVDGPPCRTGHTVPSERPDRDSGPRLRYPGSLMDSGLTRTMNADRASRSAPHGDRGRSGRRRGLPRRYTVGLPGYPS